MADNDTRAVMGRPEDYTVDGLLPHLALAEGPSRGAVRVFSGESQLQRYRRTFGGQLMAQALVAAGRTVEGSSSDRLVHSVHTTFLAGGDDARPVDLLVEPLADGRSFSVRRVRVEQDGALLATLQLSFQAASEGMEHADPMPDVPGPEGVPDVASALAGVPEPYAVVTLLHGPIELRHVEGNLYSGAPQPNPSQSVWLKAREALPDDPLVHAAYLLYASDYSILEPALRAHGIAWSDPRLRQASLDHAMWFHRAGRADEWVLHSLHSPSGSGGRGLGMGRMYAADGRLLASVAQEGMLRLKT
ncbi:MAG TPA: thioesterase family protein [Dermatophilaceae bacterium]|nr:thioesterase family protein [Dermatophilaceae bacterium]